MNSLCLLAVTVLLAVPYEIARSGNPRRFEMKAIAWSYKRNDSVVVFQLRIRDVLEKIIKILHIIA
jgi:hypothetical protein